MITDRIGRRLYSALDAQNWDEVIELASPSLMIQLGSACPIDLDAWRANHRAFLIGFPDGRHIIDESFGTEDHFVTRCRFEGTHTGQFANIAPTGIKVSVGVIHIDRYHDEQLVEHHGQLDMHGLLHQISNPD